MKMKMLAVGLALFVGACSQDSGTEVDGPTTCKSAKCDTVGLSELNVIGSDFGLCTVTPDLDAADEFFAIEDWTCQFIGLDESLPLQLKNVFTWTKQNGGSFGSTVDFTTAELDGTTKRAGSWRTDRYPITTVVAPTLSLVTSDTGRVGESNPHTSGASMRIENVLTSRPTQAIQQPMSANMEFWPVVIWPTSEFAQKFEAGDVSFFSVDISGEITMQGDSQAISLPIRYGRYAIRGNDLKALPNKTFLVPVQNGATPKLELRLESNDVTSTASVDGPGYYLMGVDGSLTRASVAEVTERGMSRTVAGVVIPDVGTDLSADAGTDVDAVDVPEPVVDPCMGNCANEEVCVNAACVSLANQVQANCNSAASALCDGEDSDCAPEHACAGGKCVRLTCQTQSAQCGMPQSVCDGEDTDCASGHACADGKCSRLTCQSQSQFCNEAVNPCEESTDCATDHVCTSGVCTRLLCKAQDAFCNAPKGACEMDNAECPADHVCADGKCKRLTCQAQDAFCNAPKGACDDDNNDCPAEQVCVAGQCRRLTCQAQDSFCNAPKGACDEGEATDCPDGHVCETGKCKRLTCL